MSILLAALVPLALSAQDPWFNAHERIVIEDGERLAAAGDFDGDGLTDLLAIDDGQVRTLLNNGSGGYSSAGSMTFSVNGNFASLQVGDITGDGVLDVLYSTSSFSTVPFDDKGASLIFWSPGLGDGTFGPEEELQSFGPLLGVTLLQADADPALEVAVQTLPTQFRHRLEVWSRDSGAWMLEAASAPILDIDGQYFPGLLAIDLDMDGVDSLVAARDLSSLAVYSRTGANLDLDSTLQQNYFISGLSRHELPATAGDFDGDGDVDLVVVQGELLGPAIDTYLNSDGLGTLSLSSQPFSTNGCNFGSSSVRALDVDGDGFLDLVGIPALLVDSEAPDCPGLAVFRGRGDGTFESPVVLPELYFAQPLAGLGDINGDGALDLVSGSSVLFKGFELPTPFPPFSYFPETPLIDLEGDGDLDLVRVPLPVSAFISEPGPFLTVWTSDGNGSASVVSALAPGALTVPEVVFGEIETLGDLDGDGLVEFVAKRTQSFGPSAVELGLWSYEYLPGLGFFPERQVSPLSDLGMDPRLLHADGDGVLDLVDRDQGVSTRVWFGQPGGTLAAPVTLFPKRLLDLADLDADGDIDFLLSDPGGAVPNQLEVQRATPAGFVSTQIFSDPFVQDFGQFLDADQDGDFDVVIQAPSGGVPGAKLLLNDGGSWNQVLSFQKPYGNRFTEFATADPDRDGLIDLLALTDPSADGLNTDSHYVYVWRRNSSSQLSFDPPRIFQVVNADGLADLDSDGDLDVASLTPALGLAESGPTAGAIQQYGEATPGTGGITPLLGATGPLQPGVADASLRIVAGLGGSPGVLAVGTRSAGLLGTPLPNLNLFVGGSLTLVPVVLGGQSGAPGAGSLLLPLADPGPFAGVQVFAQAFLFDPQTPSLIVSTNGLALTFGS